MSKKIDWNNLTEQEKMKYEIAEELGLLERVVESGWKSYQQKKRGELEV